MDYKELLQANNKLAVARKQLKVTRAARKAAQEKAKRINELMAIENRTASEENELQHLLGDVDLLAGGGVY